MRDAAGDDPNPGAVHVPELVTSVDRGFDPVEVGRRPSHLRQVILTGARGDGDHQQHGQHGQAKTKRELPRAAPDIENCIALLLSRRTTARVCDRYGATRIESKMARTSAISSADAEGW